MKKIVLLSIILLLGISGAKAQESTGRRFPSVNADGDTITYYIVDSVNRKVHVTPNEIRIDYGRWGIYYVSLYKDTLNIPPYVTLDSIEYTVTGISQMAFYFCQDRGTETRYKLYRVNMPNTIEYIGVDAFKCRDEMDTIIIPNSVKKIDAYAFASKYNVPYHSNNYIKWGDSITEIANGAFYYKFIVNLKLPNNIETIGDIAFTYSPREVVSTNLHIPSRIKRIGRNAFLKNNFDTVTISALTPPIIDSLTFSAKEDTNTSYDIVFIVPCQSYDLYSSADIWKDLSLQCDWIGLPDIEKQD